MYKYAGMSLLDYYRACGMSRLRKQANFMRAGLHHLIKPAAKQAPKVGTSISNVGTKASYNPRNALVAAGLLTGVTGAAAGAAYLRDKAVWRAKGK